MKSLKVLFESLRQRYFPTAEDEAWKNWVDNRSRETNDLIKLLSADVKDGFKKRALFLLLAPSADFNPLYWKEEIGWFYYKANFLRDLSPNLLHYAAELIVEFVTTLRPLHCGQPKTVVEGGGSITVYMQITDKYHGALYFYNECILLLLTLLPLEQGEKIFPLFSLNDISTFCNMDDASGYNPFWRLLCCKEIDLRWKWGADLAMRKIIQAELAGKIQPREKWEEALSCYARAVQMQLYYEEPECSKKLFANQLQFIIDNRKPDIHLIDSYQIIRIFRLLPEDAYKKLRHQIARFTVLESQSFLSKFFISSDDSLEAANWMLKEFGESDQELSEKIKALIEENKKQQAEHATCRVKAIEAEENILAGMR